MKNTMFMSASERQERTDKIWDYVTLACVLQSIAFVSTGIFALEAVMDSWLYVSWGVFSAISTLTCMIRRSIRDTQ